MQGGHAGSQSAGDMLGVKLVDAATQIAALPQGGQPLVVPAPAPGERVEVNLSSDTILHLAFDLRGAAVTVSDGKIVITLPNGAVLELSGEVVAQFLSGGDTTLQNVLSSAAGDTGPTEQHEHHVPSSATFQHAHPLQALGAALEGAGALSASKLGGGTSDGFHGNGGLAPIVSEAPAHPNTPPTAVDDSYAGKEDTALTSAAPGLLANDDDADGDALSVTLVSGPAHGSLTLNLDGSFIYTPDSNYSGADSFTYKVSDGHGGTDTGTVNITVAAVADAPTVVVAPAAGSEDSAIALSVGVSLVDTDGSETVAVQIAGIPVGATLSDGIHSFTATAGNTAANVTGWTISSLTLTPPANSDVDFTLTVSATSTETSNGDSATATASLPVTVIAVADAPTLAVAPATGNEDTAIALSVSPALVDTDGSESLSVQIGAIPVGATLSDGIHTFTATAGNTIANVTGWTLGSLTVTPPANSDADFTLAVSATSTESSNGDSATTTASLPVTVIAVADAPTLAVAPATGNEDTAIALSVSPVLVDTDGSESLTVQIAGIPVGATLADGIHTFMATAGNTVADVTSWTLSSLTVTPPANSDVDFTLTVSATSTESSNGDSATTTASLPVTVIAVADAPTLAVAPATGNEDTAIGLSVSPALVNTDGSETLAVKIAAIPVGATLSDGIHTFTATVGNTVADVTGWTLGSLTVTPPANSDVDFTLTVSATSTESSNGDSATTIASLPVTVIAVADAPTLSVAPATGNEDAAIALSVSPALVDTDGSESLTVQVAGIPVGATLSDGIHTFTATVGNTAVDVTAWTLPSLTVTPPANSDAGFTLTVSATSTESSNGDSATTTASLPVAIVAVNDAPSGADHTVTTNEDTAYSFSAADFGFSDAQDSPANSLLAVEIASLPTAGQLLLNGVAVTVGEFVPASEIALGHLTFVPAADANGVGYASFGFQVQDDGGTANGGVDLDPTANTITVNVTPVNDPPVGKDDSFTTKEDTSLVIAGPGVLANDTDVEGDALTAAKLTDPAHGTLTLNPDGSFTYTPDANYGGADSFTYTVNDGNGGTATATVNLTVTPVADAPTLTTAPATGNENTAIPLTVNAALVDTDGSETLAVQIGAIPVGATLSDGTHSFTATAANTTADVTGWTFAALTITRPRTTSPTSPSRSPPPAPRPPTATARPAPPAWR